MPVNEGAVFQAFLESAGRSLRDAQTALGVDRTGITTELAISDAELDVKVAVESDPRGALRIRPMGTRDVQAGAVQPEALSTVKVKYVAVAGEKTPRRSPSEVIGEIARREDVQRLERILGSFEYSARFVPERDIWLVSARAPNVGVVREVVLPDRER